MQEIIEKQLASPENFGRRKATKYFNGIKVSHSIVYTTTRYHIMRFYQLQKMGLPLEESLETILKAELRATVCASSSATEEGRTYHMFVLHSISWNEILELMSAVDHNDDREMVVESDIFKMSRIEKPLWWLSHLTLRKLDSGM